MNNTLCKISGVSKVKPYGVITLVLHPIPHAPLFSIVGACNPDTVVAELGFISLKASLPKWLMRL